MTKIEDMSTSTISPSFLRLKFTISRLILIQFEYPLLLLKICNRIIKPKTHLEVSPDSSHLEVSPDSPFYVTRRGPYVDLRARCP